MAEDMLMDRVRGCKERLVSIVQECRLLAEELTALERAVIGEADGRGEGMHGCAPLTPPRRAAPSAGTRPEAD